MRRVRYWYACILPIPVFASILILIPATNGAGFSDSGETPIPTLTHLLIFDSNIGLGMFD